MRSDREEEVLGGRREERKATRGEGGEEASRGGPPHRDTPSPGSLSCGGSRPPRCAAPAPGGRCETAGRLALCPSSPWRSPPQKRRRRRRQQRPQQEIRWQPAAGAFLPWSISQPAAARQKTGGWAGTEHAPAAERAASVASAEAAGALTVRAAACGPGRRERSEANGGRSTSSSSSRLPWVECLHGPEATGVRQGAQRQHKSRSMSCRDRG